LHGVTFGVADLSGRGHTRLTRKGTASDGTVHDDQILLRHVTPDQVDLAAILLWTGAHLF